MDALQDAYIQFANKNFVGRGAGREEISRAFWEDLKKKRETKVRGPNPNSYEFKFGPNNANSYENKFGPSANRNK
jgi:hypothetical protein